MLLVSPLIHGVNFSEAFTDETLRLDLILAGTASESHIYSSCDKRIAGWSGRRTRLGEVPAVGTGSARMYSPSTGELLYRTDFNTLFQEWQTTEEALTVARSFEQVVLLPMPRGPVVVDVVLYDNRRRAVAELRRTIDPGDALIERLPGTPQHPLKEISRAADPDHCVRVVYVPEGFTKKELPLFERRCREATEAFFALEPYRQARGKMQFTALLAPSEESGTSIPTQNVWRRTALGSHFDTFRMARYLTTPALFKMHDLLAGTPYEHIIVLVNSTTYGGGGILNSYNLTTTEHAQFLPVCVHEFGHSFGGLADEYAYANEELDQHPLDLEPVEANITRERDPAQCKWSDLVGQPNVSGGQVGLVEGAGYRTHGLFRPVENCRMRVNDCQGFCPVCQRQILKVIDFYAN